MPGLEPAHILDPRSIALTPPLHTCRLIFLSLSREFPSCGRQMAAKQDKQSDGVSDSYTSVSYQMTHKMDFSLNFRLNLPFTYQHKNVDTCKQSFNVMYCWYPINQCLTDKSTPTKRHGQEPEANVMNKTHLVYVSFISRPRRSRRAVKTYVLYALL